MTEDRHTSRTHAPHPRDRAAPLADPPAADASLLELIDHLSALLERSELAELEVEAGSTSVLLRRAEAAVEPANAQPATAARTGSPPQPAPPQTRSVLAPLTGIFYAAPTPDAPAFVTVGDEIVVGQVIGLIEAMKLFNEIKSDAAGRVERVVAENGRLVKAKDPLIEVAPNA